MSGVMACPAHYKNFQTARVKKTSCRRGLIAKQSDFVRHGSLARVYKRARLPDKFAD